MDFHEVGEDFTKLDQENNTRRKSYLNWLARTIIKLWYFINQPVRFLTVSTTYLRKSLSQVIHPNFHTLWLLSPSLTLLSCTDFLYINVIIKLICKCIALRRGLAKNLSLHLKNKTFGNNKEINQNWKPVGKLRTLTSSTTMILANYLISGRNIELDIIIVITFGKGLSRRFWWKFHPTYQ